MIKISFQTADDEVHNIEAEPGSNLMQVATGNEVPGIAAECGGSMACATCHVHVDEDWFERLPAPTSDEVAMLEFTDHPAETGRLSCQIEVTPELDGLLVRVP